MKTRACLFALMIAAPLSLALAGTQVPGSETQPSGVDAREVPQESLYERLGGVYAIAVVVDDFIERLLINETLNANVAIREARERVPKQGLKFHLTAQVCQVTGGPCQYTGRDMKVAHAHLDISAMEWQAMLDAFRTTLDKFNVPAAEKAELITIVNSTRADIVVGVRTARE